MVEEYATDNEGFRHIASVLRAGRRAKKLKFPAIVEAIRVREEYLKAMESGAFDKLPGGVYTRSHLKSYAEFLGLDSTPLLEQLDQELGALPQDEKTSMVAEPYRASFSPNPMLIIASLLGCVLAYGIWQQRNVPVPPPVNEHQKQVEVLYTDPSPAITVLATQDVTVKVIGPASAVLFDAPMHNGDTYFVPDTLEVVLQANPLAAVTLYIEGEEVASTANLEVREGGLVLNREKLLANVAVK